MTIEALRWQDDKQAAMVGKREVYPHHAPHPSKLTLTEILDGPYVMILEGDRMRQALELVHFAITKWTALRPEMYDRIRRLWLIRNEAKSEYEWPDKDVTRISMGYGLGREWIAELL